MIEAQASHISPVYKGRLATEYGLSIASAIALDWRYAELPHQTGETVAYVRLNESGNNEPPVLYIPGFSEGIIQKAPFAGALAAQGFDITFPHQNRKGIQRNPNRTYIPGIPLGKKDATYSYAMNNLAIIEAEGLENTPLNIITHSYGSLVFEAMQKIAHERKWQAFSGANVVMLAPAGSNTDENVGSLVKRFIRKQIDDRKDVPKLFGDPTGEMLTAGLAQAKANIPRSLLEGWELSQRKVDYAGIVKGGIGRLTVLGYAEDGLYSHRLLDNAMRAAIKAGVSYANPVAFRTIVGEKSERVLDPATHDDEQKNPYRVAGAVAQIFRLG